MSPTPFQAEILELRTRVIGLESDLSSKTAWSDGGWHRASPVELAAIKGTLETVRARIRALLTGIRAEEVAALDEVLRRDNLGDVAWLQRQAKQR
jgi:hypothetical protein